MNGVGMVTPRMVGSNAGPIRRAPSSQPTYQSGWAGTVATYGTYGPYSHTGLIWTRPATRTITAAVRKKRPVERKTWPGQNGSPTTFRSVSRRPRYWVWP